MNVKVMQAPYTYEYPRPYTTPVGWTDMLETVTIVFPHAQFIEMVDVTVYSVRSNDKQVAQRRLRKR
jgi:hypothetical protein